MKFNKNRKAIFLDPNGEKFELEEKVDVILSPSLYWVKKMPLPVKNVREAKKLLPSIFDDTLTEGHYNYSVYKQEDEFVIFAYDDRVILATLAEKGISSANLGEVHFAQSELSSTEGALKINETQSIYVKDEIVILLPSGWIEESGELNLEDITLSKHTIALAQFGHLIDNKSIYKITAVLVVMIALVITELFITSKKVDEIITLKEELFTKAKLQPTMFQNKAMLKKYTSLHTEQTQLRDVMGTIISLKLKNDEKLTKIDLKKKLLSADFTKLSPQSVAMITKELKAKNIKFTSSEKSESWHMEVKI